MNNFLQIQPHTCRLPLANKVIPFESWHFMHSIEKVIFLNPIHFYERIAYQLDPFARIQRSQNFRTLWPKEEHICSCGCGKILPKGRTRWATDTCCAYANQVDRIIRGDLNVVRRYLDLYYGKICVRCHRSESEIYKEEVRSLPQNNHRHRVAILSVDHIIAVKNGGGGSWLSNFQFLCHTCHLLKTKEDFA